MESSSTTTSDPVSSSGSETIAAIQRHLNALEHACHCPEIAKDMCRVDGCKEMKMLVLHSFKCTVPKDCILCRRLRGLTNVHAKGCTNSKHDCNVPGCPNAREAFNFLGLPSNPSRVETGAKLNVLLQISKPTSICPSQRLCLLKHASLCQQAACSETPFCEEIKQLLKHMRTCPQDVFCSTPNCISSKFILNHFFACKRIIITSNIATCPVCDPIQDPQDDTKIANHIQTCNHCSQQS